MIEIYLLIRTDGYTIETEKFDTKQDAFDEMKYQFENAKPANYNPDDWDECSSYLNDYQAELSTGYDVFLWKIVRIN